MTEHQLKEESKYMQENLATAKKALKEVEEQKMQLAFENKVVWVQTKAFPFPLPFPPSSLLRCYVSLACFAPSPPFFLLRLFLHAKIEHTYIALSAAQRTASKYKARLAEVEASTSSHPVMSASRSSRPQSPAAKRPKPSSKPQG